MIGEEDPVPVIPPGLDVTVYVVPAGFPRYEGAENVTDAVALPPVADPIVGVPGVRPSEEPVTPRISTIYNTTSFMLASLLDSLDKYFTPLFLQLWIMILSSVIIPHL